MRNVQMGAMVTVLTLVASGVSAGIPEPDAILYGPACIAGRVVHSTEDVTVVARVDAVSNPIGVFRFNEPAPTNCGPSTPLIDCNRNCIEDRCDISCSTTGCSTVVGCGSSKDANGDGIPDECPGDNYVLRIRLESLDDGAPPSNSAAHVGQTIRLALKQGTAAEVPAGSFVVTDRGIIMQRNISDGGIYNFDGDHDSDLRDFAKLQNCFTGLGSPPTPGCQGADINSDGKVNLPDLQIFGACMNGPL